jgi:hypothetical protein
MYLKQHKIAADTCFSGKPTAEFDALLKSNLPLNRNFFFTLDKNRIISLSDIKINYFFFKLYPKKIINENGFFFAYKLATIIFQE